LGARISEAFNIVGDSYLGAAEAGSETIKNPATTQANLRYILFIIYTL